MERDTTIAISIRDCQRVEFVGQRHMNGTVKVMEQTLAGWSERLQVEGEVFRLEDSEERDDISPSGTPAWYVPAE